MVHRPRRWHPCGTPVVTVALERRTCAALPQWDQRQPAIKAITTGSASQSLRLKGKSRQSIPAWRQVVWDSRGAVTTELVIATPALLLLILLIAQFTVWAHATHIAQAAASETLAATRVYGGTTSAGYTEATRVLGQLGDGPLRSPATTITRSANQSSVEIRGEATTIVPFLHLPVVARAAGPTERITTGGTG